MTDQPLGGGWAGGLHDGAVRGGDADLLTRGWLSQRIEDRRLQGHEPDRLGRLRRRDLPRRSPPEPVRRPDRRLPGGEVDRSRLPGQGRRQAGGRSRHRRASPRPSTACRSCPTRTWKSTSAKASAARWRPRLPAAPISTEADLTPWRDPNLATHFSLPPRSPPASAAVPVPAALAPFAPQAKGGTLNSRAGAYAPFYLHLTRTGDRTGDRLLLGRPSRPACWARSPVSPTAPRQRSKRLASAPGSRSETIHPAPRRA